MLAQVINTNKTAIPSRDRYTITNLATFGNFDDATGWLSLAGTVSASNNKLITAYDGVNQSLEPYYNTSIPMSSLYGKIISISVKVSPVGDIAPRYFWLRLRGTTAGTKELSTYVVDPTKNEEIKLGIHEEITADYGSGNLRIYIQETFPAGTSDITGCSLECREMLLINTTDSYGIGNEPTIDQLNQILANLSTTWFSGDVVVDARVSKYQLDAANSKLDAMNLKIDVINSAMPRYQIELFKQRFIFAVWRNILLSFDYVKNEVSFDAGETWQDCTGITAADNPIIGVIFRTGKAVVFGTTAYYYSDDCISFTKVLYSTAGIAAAPYYSGVSLLPGQAVDTAIFGEYTASFTGSCKLWKSTDAGKTWATSLDVQTSIRHFHTTAYCRHVTYGGMLATSGDVDEQIQWWLSSDWGTNWTKIVDGGSQDVLDPQNFRTIGQVFDEDANVFWGTDNDYNDMTAIYKAPLNNPLQKTKVFDMAGVCYGIRQAGGIFVAISKPSSVQGNTASYIYCSQDSGKTWDVVMKELPLAITPTNNPSGFNRIIGPDCFGRFYIFHPSMANGQSGTYRLDITNRSIVL